MGDILPKLSTGYASICLAQTLDVQRPSLKCFAVAAGVVLCLASVVRPFQQEVELLTTGD